MPQAAELNITTAIDRPALLAGIHSLSASADMVRAFSEDEILRLIAERRAAQTLAMAADTDDEGFLADDRVDAIDLRLICTRPRTLAGAIAAIELARDVYAEEAEGGMGDSKLVPRLLDAAAVFLSSIR